MEGKQNSYHSGRSREAASQRWLRRKKARALRLARSTGREYRKVENRTTVFKLAALLTFFVLGLSTLGMISFAVYSKELPSTDTLASRQVFQPVRITEGSSA